MASSICRSKVAGAEKLIEKRVKELSAGDIKVTLQRFSGTPEMNEVLIDWGALGLPGLLIVWEKTLGR
jgi:hypothetical protein